MELIGKTLAFRSGEYDIRGKIVETEAYLGGEDPASHAYRGVTPRNQVMFGEGGFSYVYFTYGFHYCFNVVTEKEGVAGAVLIRAVEPLSEVPLMKQRRKCEKLTNLTNGPGKLTQAFGITGKDSGRDLTEEDFHIDMDLEEEDFLQIGVSSRIGIREAVHFPYRFFLKESPFVSCFNGSGKVLCPPLALKNK